MMTFNHERLQSGKINELFELNSSELNGAIIFLTVGGHFGPSNNQRPGDKNKICEILSNELFIFYLYINLRQLLNTIITLFLLKLLRLDCTRKHILYPYEMILLTIGFTE